MEESKPIENKTPEWEKEWNKLLEDFIFATNFLRMVQSGRNQYDEGSKVWLEYEKDVAIGQQDLEEKKAKLFNFLSLKLTLTKQEIL